MGAYVSVPDCTARRHVLNCDPPTTVNGTVESIGGVTKGTFQPDPDVAGIGVLGAFIAVTSLSLLLSIISGLWWLSKYIFKIKTRYTEEEKARKRWQLSVTGLCETLVVTCSDQQIFTGLAYAVTLRYSKGCEISAYHYNIVANMMLLTCATHLMAVAISRHYWEHPFVASLRVVITAGVYLATGVMLSNQGAIGNGFPTEIPQANATDSLMFMQAACFQNSTVHFASTLGDSFSSVESTKDALLHSQIHGWNLYLAMLLFYAVALVVGLGRFIRYGARKNGKRANIGVWARRTCAPLFRLELLFHLIFALYLAGGIAIAAWTVADSALYISGLRKWVNASGWLALNDGRNPEDDPTTFGQLVPLLLIALTVFTMLQVLSERLTIRRIIEEEDANPGAISGQANYIQSERLPDIYGGGPRKEGKEGTEVQVTRMYTGETAYTDRSTDYTGRTARTTPSHSRTQSRTTLPKTPRI